MLAFFIMKAMVITTKIKSEFKFVNYLLKKLGVLSATPTEEGLEGVSLFNS